MPARDVLHKGPYSSGNHKWQVACHAARPQSKPPKPRLLATEPTESQRIPGRHLAVGADWRRRTGVTASTPRPPRAASASQWGAERAARAAGSRRHSQCRLSHSSSQGSPAARDAVARAVRYRRKTVPAWLHVGPKKEYHIGGQIGQVSRESAESQQRVSRESAGSQQRVSRESAGSQQRVSRERE